MMMGPPPTSNRHVDGAPGSGDNDQRRFGSERNVGPSFEQPSLSSVARDDNPCVRSYARDGCVASFYERGEPEPSSECV